MKSTHLKAVLILLTTLLPLSEKAFSQSSNPPSVNPANSNPSTDASALKSNSDNPNKNLPATRLKEMALDQINEKEALKEKIESLPPLDEKEALTRLKEMEELNKKIESLPPGIIRELCTELRNQLTYRMLLPSNCNSDNPNLNLPSTWLKEMESLKDPEIIEAGTRQEKITRKDRNIIIKGRVNGPVNLVNGQCYVLGSVQGPVAVVDGSVTVLGTVKDSVHVERGDIRVAGRIEGSANVVNGKILRNPAATIAGNKHKCFNTHNQSGFSFPIFYKYKISAAVLSIIFAILLVLIWPEHITESAKELGHNPLRYGAIGLVFWAVFWVLFAVALVASILLIGLPFVALLILILVAVNWYGFTVVFSWIGGSILRKIRGVESSSLVAVLTGGLLLEGLSFIPFLGWLLIWAAGWLAAGVAVLNVLRKTRSSNVKNPIS